MDGKGRNMSVIHCGVGNEASVRKYLEKEMEGEYVREDGRLCG